MLGPNILGNNGINYVAGAGFRSGSGALTSKNSQNYATSGLIDRKSFELTLNAHNSNSIYTDSGKVYPLSFALNFIIKC